MSKIIENYCLEEHLGTDFYGYDSFRAKHIQNHQSYLVKGLNRSLYNGPGFYKQGLDTESISILKQVSTLNKVAHINIIRYEKMLKTAHNIYVVYEFCAGGSLYDRILANRVTDIQQVNYMRQLAQVINKFHKQDLVVASLHPKNIYIGKDNNLKLTNFAHCLNIKANQKAQYDPKNMEYHDYLSPDTFASHASDIYSLGLVFSFIKYGKITNLDSMLSSKIKAKDPTAELIQAMIAKQSEDRIDLDTVKSKLGLSPQLLQNRSCQIDVVKNPKSARKISQDMNSVTGLKVEAPGSKSISRQGSIDESKSKKHLLSPAKIVLLRSERSLTDTKSQADNQNQENSKQTKKLMKDRNKYTYLLMIANDVIVQDLTPSCNKLAYLICKKARINAKMLQKSMVSMLIREQDAKTLSTLLKSQISEVQKFFERFKQSISQQSKLLQDSAFELQYENDENLSEAYLRKLLRDYVSTVFTPIDPNNKSNQESSVKLLHHINNVCDIQILDKFFNDYINDSVVNLLDQIYFIELDKMELKEMHRFVLEKMTMDKII